MVDWDKLPGAEKQEILEREIKLAEEALDGAESEAYLASMASLDRSQHASSLALHPTNPRNTEMTKEEVHQAIGSLSQLMTDLTDCIMALTNQLTILAASPAVAAATPACTKCKDTVKRPEPWKGKGGTADARHFLAAFSNWAFHMEDQLNDWSASHSNWDATMANGYKQSLILWMRMLVLGSYLTLRG